MRLFVIGFAVPWLVLLAMTEVWAWPFASAHTMNGTMLAVKLFGVPVGAAWLVYELLQAIRPSRIFNPRAGRPVRAGILGFMAGVLSVAATIGAFAFDAPGQHDVFVVGASGAGAAALVLLMLRRVRRDRCVRCNYDTQGLALPRCPECGTFVE